VLFDGDLPEGQFLFFGEHGGGGGGCGCGHGAIRVTEPGGAEEQQADEQGGGQASGCVEPAAVVPSSLLLVLEGADSVVEVGQGAGFAGGCVGLVEGVVCVRDFAGALLGVFLVEAEAQEEVLQVFVGFSHGL